MASQLNQINQPEACNDSSGKLTRQDLMIILHDLVYILSAVAVIFMFFFRVVTVEGDSMNPTLCNRDRVIMLSGIWYDDPAAGDIVVARIPSFSAEPLIKRIIAVEGDTVDIDYAAGNVLVNGESLQEAYIPEPTFRDFEEAGLTFPQEIGEGCVFLLGDNRNMSYDSRFYLIGQVDRRNILGKVVFLAFPGRSAASGRMEYSRIGMIEQEVRDGTGNE